MPVCRIPAIVQLLYRRGLYRAPGKDSPLYLTFDDGPHPDYTPLIAGILTRAGITGHFFMTGERAREYPGIVKDVAAAGHVIGCHGERHLPALQLSAADELRNYGAGCDTLRGITGHAPLLVRPPHGRIRGRTSRELARRGLRVVLYDVIPYDYRNPEPAIISRRIVRSVRNGSIILLHDGGGDRRRTAESLPGTLSALTGRFTWGRLDHL